MRTGSRASAIAAFMSTPSAPNSMATAGSEAEATPACTLIRAAGLEVVAADGHRHHVRPRGLMGLLHDLEARVFSGAHDQARGERASGQDEGVVRRRHRAGFYHEARAPTCHDKPLDNCRYNE